MDEFKKCSRSQRGMKIEESNSELNIQLIRGKVNKKLQMFRFVFPSGKLENLPSQSISVENFAGGTFADPRSMIEFRLPEEGKVEKYCHLI